jgi:hypothetical protein
MAPTRQRDLVEGAEAFRLLMIERGPFSPSIDRPGSETTGQCAFGRRAQATEAPPATSAQHPEEIETNKNDQAEETSFAAVQSSSLNQRTAPRRRYP